MVKDQSKTNHDNESKVLKPWQSAKGVTENTKSNECSRMHFDKFLAHEASSTGTKTV